jgi:RNA polymerase primary sigma factor
MDKEQVFLEYIHEADGEELSKLVLNVLWRNPEEFDIDEFLVLIGREELLGAEEERMLIEQAQRDGGVSADSSRAMSRLKCRMLRFVVSLVNQYQNQGLSLQTLIKAGLIGLERAVMDYDVNSEEKFLHFAVPKMRKVVEYCIGIGGLPKPQRKLKITKSVTNRTRSRILVKSKQVRTKGDSLMSAIGLSCWLLPVSHEKKHLHGITAAKVAVSLCIEVNHVFRYRTSF